MKIYLHQRDTYFLSTEQISYLAACMGLDERVSFQKLFHKVLSTMLAVHIPINLEKHLSRFAYSSSLNEYMGIMVVHAKSICRVC